MVSIAVNNAVICVVLLFSLFFLWAKGIDASTVTYTYANLNRLIKVESVEYTYDEVGNRLSKSIGPICELGDMKYDEVFDIFDLMKLINKILAS